MPWFQDLEGLAPPVLEAIEKRKAKLLDAIEPTALTESVELLEFDFEYLEKERYRIAVALRVTNEIRQDFTLHFTVDSGVAALTAGRSAESLLFLAAAGSEDGLNMPPEDEREKFPALTAEELDVLKRWIDAGAVWPEGVKLKSGGY